ncbi:MAG TPA: hypothetical protein VMV69_01690 [Pirellulales bacterium]|nr:hypothetical protein [Pirellulales bacterium]
MAIGMLDDVLCEDVEREQRELDEFVAKVREMFHQEHAAATACASRLIDTLDELREHLGMLFALKERGGYLDEAIVTAPRLREAAASLKQQHQALFIALGRLIDQCENDLDRRRWRDLRQLDEMTFENFCDQLRAQQEREAELVQRAAGDDVGD